MGSIKLMWIILLVQSELSDSEILNNVQERSEINSLFWGSIALNILLVIILIFLFKSYSPKSKIVELEGELANMKVDLKKVKIQHSNIVKRLEDENLKLSQIQSNVTEVFPKIENEEKNYVEDNSVVIELSIENTNPEVNLFPAQEKSVGNDIDVSPKTYYATCEQENDIGFLIIENKRSHRTPYQIQEVEGKYSFVVDSLNRDALQNAINFYNIYVNPFCIPSNTFQDYYKSFIAEKDSKGILEKDGEKFRVVEKLKIRFLDI